MNMIDMSFWFGKAYSMDLMTFRTRHRAYRTIAPATGMNAMTMIVATRVALTAVRSPNAVISAIKTQ